MQDRISQIKKNILKEFDGYNGERTGAEKLASVLNFLLSDCKSVKYFYESKFAGFEDEHRIRCEFNYYVKSRINFDDFLKNYTTCEAHNDLFMNKLERIADEYIEDQANLLANYIIRIEPAPKTNEFGHVIA